MKRENQTGRLSRVITGRRVMDVPGTGADAVNRALVGDAVAQLSEEHRAVVALSYYRGWTIAQIAADLGIAEGTVKSRLHYALRSLRQALVEMGMVQ